MLISSSGKKGDTLEAGRIIKVSGPLVIADNMAGARMYDLVRVSKARLMGEIIELHGEQASIQVYEETGGLGPGEPVYNTGTPLSVELGPGLIEGIFDGVQRPLNIIHKQVGDYITRGVEVFSLDRERTWLFEPRVKVEEQVQTGDILGTVQESTLVEHRIMLPDHCLREDLGRSGAVNLPLPGYLPGRGGAGGRGANHDA